MLTWYFWIHWVKYVIKNNFTCLLFLVSKTQAIRKNLNTYLAHITFPFVSLILF